ncbi:hypothetical protein MRX96_033884 [Rhipicephalus microplus]
MFSRSTKRGACPVVQCTRKRKTRPGSYDCRAAGRILMVRTPKVSCSLVFRFVGHVLMEQPAAPRDLRQAGVLTSSVDAGLPYHVCADTLSPGARSRKFSDVPRQFVASRVDLPE